MKLRLTGHIIDDCCLFCGAYSGIRHAYVGKVKENGNIECTEPKGWLIIPHLSNCEVAICPECLRKIRKAGIKL